MYIHENMFQNALEPYFFFFLRFQVRYYY